MKLLNFLLITLSLTFSVFGQNIPATTENGKKVVLKPDNTWEYVKVEPQNESQNYVDDYEAAFSFAENNNDKLTKSEYESESQYKDRLIEFFSTIQKPYIFAISNNSLSYDAETEKFHFLFGRIRVDVSFVERELSYTAGRSMSEYFPVPRTNAKEIKENAEILVYGFPIQASPASDNSPRLLRVMPVKLEIKNKFCGGMIVQKSFPSFFFAAEDKSESDQNKSSDNSSPSTQSTPETNIRVRGYYRRDGTYVRPHIRSASKRKN